MPPEAFVLTGHHLMVFTLGYLLVLLTPGPNFIVLAGISLVRGFRGALPLCCGITLGSVGIATAAALAADLVPDSSSWDGASRAAGGLLLLYVAWRLLSASPAGPAVLPSRGDFALGFGTALLNPITGAYFASHFLAMRSDWRLADHLVILAIAGGVAFLRSLAVAAVFGGLVWRVRDWRLVKRLAQATGAAFALVALWLLATAAMGVGQMLAASKS
jgi:threonine/homoserine/homoserine lactone efflux protein